MDVTELVRRQGGVAHRSRLLGAGASYAQIRGALRRERLVLVRRGWYAVPGAPPDVVVAVRAGGQLSCASRLRHAGIWVAGRPDGVHVAVARNAARLPTPPAAVHRHWRDRPGRVCVALDSIGDALRHHVHCVGMPDAIAAVDSALHLGLIDLDGLWAARIPARVIALADGRAESGGESLLRLRLAALRLGFAVQHEIPGVGRVDFLVGRSLVIEVDGFAFHGDRAAFESDRRRDQELHARGYTVIRLTYRQLAEDWERVERCILAVHRSRRGRQLV